MLPFEFDALLHQVPFRPFRMRLSLNITLEVKHPEMAIAGMSIVKVYSDASDDEQVVSLAHIVYIEYLPKR